ncbi:MAG: hypothetical protein Q7R83_00315 [bacterium]|nr:hypothetical protein [bacterium]
MRFSRQTVISLCLLASFFAPPMASIAQTTATTSAVDAAFDPTNILNDTDLFEFGGMTPERIQDFLQNKGTLGSIKLTDTDGVQKSPAEIIWRIATSYKVSPRYLMALLQKEQSLIEDPAPKQKQFDWATGYAICDSCSKDDPSVQQFKGFASQVEWAAKQFREKYLIQILGKGTTIAGYAPGKIIKIDGQTFVPKNLATAMLYSYTPHIHGNLNLWRIWQRWFSLSFPDGTVVRGITSKKMYLIRFGEKKPFKSPAVAFSMVDMNKIVDVDDSQLAGYPLGQTIAFPNYALVQTPDKKRYLIVGTTKRLIVNRTVFSKLGFNEDEVVPATVADLTNYDDGADITLTTAYPTGLLGKDAKGGYWYVENNVRHAIANMPLLKLYFKNQPAKLLTATKLATLKVGTPYALHDGELVKATGDAAVYVMENGQRRPIPSGQVFEEIGWKWKNVVVLPAAFLNTYPIGDPVTPRMIIALPEETPIVPEEPVNATSTTSTTL